MCLLNDLRSFVFVEIILFPLQWLALLKSMLREAQWLKNEFVPTMDEYMKNAYVSFALGPIVLPALYLVGPKLSEDVKGHRELHHLYRLMSSSGRLLNDIQGFKVKQEVLHL